MQPTNKKRYYTPPFSELATVTIRRFAWSLNIPMTRAIDLIASSLPSIYSPSAVCPKCKDNTKCALCGFHQLSTTDSGEKKAGQEVPE